MDESTQGIGTEFWQGLIIAVFCAVVTFILFKRRHWWIRCMDAEESFWERFGLRRSKGGLRAFGESRVFRIGFAVMTAVIFVLLAIDVMLYFKLKRQRMEVERNHK